MQCSKRREEEIDFFLVLFPVATSSYVDTTAFIYIYTAFLLSVNAGLPNRAVSTLRHADQMTKPKVTTSMASHRICLYTEVDL